MTTEFKTSLDWLHNQMQGMTMYEGHPYIAIERALKIADRLNSEPDMTMAGAAMKAWDVQMKNKESRSWPVMMCTVFKAMVKELLKEVDG